MEFIILWNDARLGILSMYYAKILTCSLSTNTIQLELFKRIYDFRCDVHVLKFDLDLN